MLLLLIIVAIGFIYKIYSLKVSHDGYWAKLGDDLTLFQVKIEAERGNIYTHDGRVLATTIPTFELRMDMKADGLTDTLWNKHVDSVCMGLAKWIPERTESEWKAYFTEARNSSNRHLLLSKNIDFQTFKKIREIPLFKLGKNKSGFITLASNSRKFPFGDLARRTIGYVSVYNKSQIGIEGQFNEDLAGENKQVLMQKVAGGVYMPVNDDSDFGSKPGYDIYTTLDINLQDIAESSLMSAVQNFNADHGSVILMNVKTGEIKAIANLGKTKKGEYKEIYNYAIGELNTPGSVMKLASIMALIDEGYCDENSQIDLGNGIHKFYDDVVFEDDHKVFGNVSLSRAFEVSSNIGMAKPVVKYFNKDKEKYYHILEKYHLTKSYGLGLKGEATPVLKPSNEWDGGTLPNLARGYEILTTPIQILGLYAAIANNGKMMKPYLIKEVRDNDQIVTKYEPEIIDNQIVKPSTIQAVRSMLEKVVDSGTASNIRNKNYKIAGKTGTSKLLDENNKYSNKLYQSSFVGYFPANNPVYACIVVVNKPEVSKGYYGGTVAAPVFKAIADRLYTTDKEIHPPLADQAKGLFLNSIIGLKSEIENISKYFGWNTVKTDINSEWATTISNNSSLVMKPSYFSNKSTMPNVVRMNLRDAIYLLESMGLNVTIQGKGKVKSQTIKPGEKIYKGSQVILTLG